MTIQETQTLADRGVRASQAQYGSDYVVELLSSLAIPYMTLIPGSSYRGIQDSLVNFDTPGKPELVLCNHEEVAVAVSRGYAAATGKPMLTALHNVVGLQNAVLGIYSAWVGRLPMMILGGTGPLSSDKPHLEWVHTALIQGNIVRDIVKWDDQPASITRFAESIMRAHRITTTEPNGPVYLCFDQDLQEAAVTQPLQLPDPSLFAAPAATAPDPAALQEAARLLSSAQSPVIVADSVGRHREAVPALAELAELLQAPVISSGARFNMASNHPLNLTAMRAEVLPQADVVLALDVFNLSDVLGIPHGAHADGRGSGSAAKVIHISVWDLMQHSLTTDFGRLTPVDLPITGDTSLALPLLIAECRRALEADSGSRGRVEDRKSAIEALRADARSRRVPAAEAGDGEPIPWDRVSSELAEVVKNEGVPFTISGNVRGGGWQLTSPDHMIGGVSGGGLGLATGAAIGVALAYRNTDRMIINMVGDGEFLFTPSSLWTAANMGLPVLTVINNNRSYGSDEGHQEFVARERGRPVENRGVGIYIEKPDVNFAALAGSFGVEGFGPVDKASDVRRVLEAAVNVVAREKRPALVDIRTARRPRMG
jgi:acetolactate synthase-1/2/3 large subunit